jgi:hypothetical protein
VETIDKLMKKLMLILTVATIVCFASQAQACQGKGRHQHKGHYALHHAFHHGKHRNA